MSFGLVIDPGRGQRVQVGDHHDLRWRPVLARPTVSELDSGQDRRTVFLTAEVQDLERARDSAVVFRRRRRRQQLLLEQVLG
jgi:hypothetical protein